MGDHTKEEYAEFHRVLKLAREQAGTGSDLDILYRLGYWEAVQDHTNELAAMQHWKSRWHRLNWALHEIIKINADAEDSDCECDSCKTLKVARETIYAAGEVIQSGKASTNMGIIDYMLRPTTDGSNLKRPSNSDGIQFQRTTTGGKA